MSISASVFREGNEGRGGKAGFWEAGRTRTEKEWETRGEDGSDEKEVTEESGDRRGAEDGSLNEGGEERGGGERLAKGSSSRRKSRGGEVGVEGSLGVRKAGTKMDCKERRLPMAGVWWRTGSKGIMDFKEIAVVTERIWRMGSVRGKSTMENVQRSRSEPLI